MNREKILEQFEDCPVVAAIKNEEGLEACLRADIRIVFVLYGDICSIKGIVDRLKAAGKTVMIHLDLVGGLGSREVIVDYVLKTTSADGIISTRPALIKRAKELEYFAIMRFFMLDSMAYDSVRKQMEHVKPDMIEMIPGAMPKVITRLCDLIGGEVPIIAGGLITDKEDTITALGAGATAISTTKQSIWFM